VYACAVAAPTAGAEPSPKSHATCATLANVERALAETSRGTPATPPLGTLTVLSRGPALWSAAAATDLAPSASVAVQLASASPAPSVATSGPDRLVPLGAASSSAGGLQPPSACRSLPSRLASPVPSSVVTKAAVPRSSAISPTLAVGDAKSVLSASQPPPVTCRDSSPELDAAFHTTVAPPPASLPSACTGTQPGATSSLTWSTVHVPPSRSAPSSVVAGEPSNHVAATSPPSTPTSRSGERSLPVPAIASVGVAAHAPPL